ncbi:hypothetical protein LRS06_03620 [Hymenobacter sp. J193]|uniref:hypothetical protein n=1 Tax=Hymenobacter sp. J193 TaxID=2898429 RepID=UPI002151A9F8|nr:hypothetical protein [Hymenobacter sp. J193]MCR5886876.1 hypothetical protein [Hymenobacter sp. J193]
MVKDQFINVTIRGRFLFGVCSLQKAIYHFNFEKLDWQMLFDFLLEYPKGDAVKDLCLWSDKQSECIPFCIMDDKPYEECLFEFITKQQYNYFKSIYKQVNQEICEIIDLIDQIGTCSLYGGVRDGSPMSLEYLNRITKILDSNRIEKPELENFNNFTYKYANNDRAVWGEKIDINIIELILNNNKESAKQPIWRYNA